MIGRVTCAVVIITLVFLMCLALMSDKQDLPIFIRIVSALTILFGMTIMAMILLIERGLI